MFLYDFSRFSALKSNINRIFIDLLCLVDRGKLTRLSATVARGRSRLESADSTLGCRLVADLLAMAPFSRRWRRIAESALVVYNGFRL